MFETFEAERKVRPPFVTGQGMDLVDDHRSHPGEGKPAAFGGQVQVETFGRGHQDGGRFFHHGGAGARSRVASAYRDGDRRNFQAELLGFTRYLSQRPLEVLLDVHGQRLEWRNVDDPCPALQVFTGRMSPVGLVNGHQEAGQCLA